MHLGVVVVAQVAPGLILGDGGEGSWHYCRSMQDQGEPRTRSDDHGDHGGHDGGGGVDGDDCGGGGEGGYRSQWKLRPCLQLSHDQ